MVKTKGKRRKIHQKQKKEKKYIFDQKGLKRISVSHLLAKGRLPSEAVVKRQ